ncbi:tRNA lysidine(34) synthetase TilS [Psychrobacter sp. Cmf 22.2]|uniref:tRNA lysidine(34) synthetase TilS n=1 Tax=Psychrobacter sp. Cmf 22.2 TaxID=1926478 RepID=UPI000946D59B|nr:tRNA lysidine(34) synthetase TilS [Psychrobacter sp. Cmf 22.2]OLF37557.1 tRNA lysidine(34) synthetase TilS [Psychrobacter sp. Cmf 22.2]
MTSRAILNHPIKPVAQLPIDDNLAEALLVSMAEYSNQLHGRRIWLACSGGRDSLALAALCVQLYQQGKLPFLPQLLHVDHGLQVDSGYWAEHVTSWARAQQLPCQVLMAKVDGHDEQAARLARYRIMRAHINQDDVLLLAHHADDQAETVLMRLIQGAGVNGLSGMQAWREQTQSMHRNILWRPWLSVRRSTISHYARQLKLPYIDDPTNDSGDNVRSGLRRDIMPALATYNSNVIDNIARSAQLLADAQAIVSDQAVQDLQQTAIIPPATVSSYPPFQRVLNIDELHTLPIYRQRQLLHTWLAQDEPLPPTKQLVDNVLNLTERNDHDHQTQLDWQGSKQTYTIRRYRQQLYRLSSSWLTWLALPLTAHTQTLPCLSLPQKHAMMVTLRTGKGANWQLKITLNTLIHFINDRFISDNIISDKDKIELTCTPLGRQQRVQTTLATRPQAGKKLYQTLGVPVWLRDSLVVVSIVFAHKDEALPLLLVSPFESWVLGTDKALANVTNDSVFLASAIKNILSI